MNAREAWSILKDAARDWSDDEAPRLAAALAYYTLLSIAPLVVVATSVAGLALGDEAARGQIGEQLGAAVGPKAAEGIQTVIANARTPSSGVIGSVVGIVVALVGASGVFGELQSSMNTIWEVAPKPGRGLWGLVKARFFSFTMVLGVAFLMLVTLVVSAALAAAGSFFSDALPGGEAVWQVVTSAASFAIVTGIFALIFRVIPDVEIRWSDVWAGAVATAFLFTLGKLGLGLYLGKAAVTSSYGAAGSLVALVVWVYYSAQILFFGAELTQVYAKRHGHQLVPTKDAIPIERRREKSAKFIPTGQH